jgi:hypothetical protein
VERIAGRYIVEATLGKGGMGTVYRVRDELRGGERLALKRISLPTDSSTSTRRTTLFEREYHTLAQLRHPRIVSVYDYGIDSESAYYTMELFEGVDLKQKAPVPWRELCVLLRDVASALALVHARKLVHRDVTPRNIHCAADTISLAPGSFSPHRVRAARAKLFDFGAMAPMQFAKDLVGTPQFVPPESILGQSPDGRADLFALGATAYWVLTGHHAYPARSLDELMDAWRTKPREPRALNSEVPEALSELVMSMLNLDRLGRPSSAAEVMDRLEAIADLPADEQLAVAHSYLATPTLVGREQATKQVRDQLRQACQGAGGFTLIEGEAGVGRSRFLEVGVLEATLMGMTVLRADALAGSEEYGAAKAVARQLLRTAPEAARDAALPYADVLAYLAPELRSDPGSDAAATLAGLADSRDFRPRLHAALCNWFLGVSERCCLLVAADDVHRFDEPSAALIAALATRANEKSLVVLATAEAGAPATSPAAMRLLSQAGSHQQLGRLDGGQTRELLVSVFGDIPNIEVVSKRIHELADGNPRACMDLAQHLVDRGSARYSGGQWLLPPQLKADDLPATLADSFAARLRGLSSTARRLAEALAVGAEDGLLAADVRGVVDEASSSEIFGALEELRMARVLDGDSERHRFMHTAWIDALESALTPERKRELHRWVAKVAKSRGDDVARVIQHLLDAGDEAPALDALVESLKTFDRPRVRPAGYMATLEHCLETRVRLGRPRRERILIEAEIIRMAIYQACTHAELVEHVRSVAGELAHNCGLTRLAEMQAAGDARSPRDRLTAALADAHQTYLATPENERGLSPMEAIKELGLLTRVVSGVAGSTFDLGLLELLPSLEPLAPMSPALLLAVQLVRATRELVAGNRLQAARVYGSIRERMAQPDRGGLEPMVHWYTDLALIYSIGLIEASVGIPAALRWADLLDADPAYRGNAHRIRAIVHLNQGETELAAASLKQAELWTLQSLAVQAYEGTTLRSEIEALAIAQDLTGVKVRIDTIAALAERFPGWVPWLHFARGAYQRLRGDDPAALEEFEAGMAVAVPGRHPAWPVLAGGWLTSARRLGRNEEVRQRGREWLAVSTKLSASEAFAFRITVPLALAEARLGADGRALELIDSTVRALEERGTRGLSLGQVYEAAAQIAIWRRDAPGFERFARLCAEHFHSGQSAGLTARCTALMDQAREAGLVSSEAASSDSVREAQIADDVRGLSTTFARCHGVAERAAHALKLLVSRSQAAGGYLFALHAEAPSLVATLDDEPPAPALHAWVREYVAAHARPQDDLEDHTQTRSAVQESWQSPSGHQLRPVFVRGTRDGDESPVALAVLRESPHIRIEVPVALVRAIGEAMIQAADAQAMAESIPRMPVYRVPDS